MCFWGVDLGVGQAGRIKLLGDEGKLWATWNVESGEGDPVLPLWEGLTNGLDELTLSHEKALREWE